MVKLYQLPVERYSPRDKQSYTTVVKRWPVILTNIVSSITVEIHALANDDPKLAEGKKLISTISGLKHEMGRNGVLKPIPDDGGANIACYNDELAATPDEEKKWFTADWLFAECYLYRLLRSIFALTEHWKEYDPFFTSKADTFRASATAVAHLAKAVNTLVEEKDELAQGAEVKGSPMEIAFWEMIQADLWGNATDLSLLVDLDYADLQKLQAVGAAAQAEQAKLILRNDFAKVWDVVKGLSGGRVDIVLDNAGFELYTDLIFADFLVSCTPFVGEVVFHPKTIPWFVSDVVPYDFSWLFRTLHDSTFFPTLPAADHATLATLATRWDAHLASGRFRLSIPETTPLGADVPAANFWTTQYAYQDLPAVDPTLLAELQKADLVVFKGDLNYRKLIGDAKWPTTTPFETALGPLAGQFNLVSLRTNKADTICGLDEGVEARVEQEAKDWRVSGKYAVVSFCPKA